MKRAGQAALVAIAALLLAGCGQDEVKFPDTGGAGGACGPWYPGGGGDADGGVDGGAEAEYAVEEGAIFPCAVWESARLNGEDIFIDVGNLYLQVKHGQADYKSLVIEVSARNCGPCQVLTNAILDRKDEFDAAGAYMIAMARRDLQGEAGAPDFDIDEAYEVMEDEGWPVESWPVINDAEDYLPLTMDTDTPWLIIVRFSDMQVMVASNLAFSPDENGVDDLLEFLNGPDFP